MHIFSAVLYAVSANIDALSIGIAYGIKKTHINHQNNFMIAFITMIGTYGAMRFGHFLTNYISLSLADFLGSSLLLLIGIYTVVKSLKECDEIIVTNHLSAVKNISLKETLVLSLVLTINNVALGIGASITGMPELITSLTTFVCSYVFIGTGQKFKRLNFKGKYADIISGIILIILGLYELTI